MFLILFIAIAYIKSIHFHNTGAIGRLRPVAPVLRATMNVLIVYAHPEPRSLNGAIRDFSVERLRRAGHDVQLSDLYAMRWKATFDAADFPDRDANEPLDPEGASKHAYETGTQTPDIAAEQDKLRQADVLILQFPMWWYTMPAILKGWVDRG